MIQLLATGATSALSGISSSVGKELTSIEQKWFGGGARDSARQARVDWFHSAAKAGSVYAARIMLGAHSNTSANEWDKEWQGAVSALGTERPDVMAAAVSQGPYWDTHDNDTSDRMRALVNSELSQLGVTQQLGGIPSTGYQPLPSNPITQGIAQAVQGIGAAAGTGAANAIDPAGHYVTVPTDKGTLLFAAVLLLGLGYAISHHHKTP